MYSAHQQNEWRKMFEIVGETLGSALWTQYQLPRELYDSEPDGDTTAVLLTNMDTTEKYRKNSNSCRPTKRSHLHTENEDSDQDSPSSCCGRNIKTHFK